MDFTLFACDRIVEMMSHAIFTPGRPGWLEQVSRAIEVLQPDSFKGYTIGDDTDKHLRKYPWLMDDEMVRQSPAGQGRIASVYSA
ncbi:MAG TPA: hypothetical protein VLK82_19340 [Candidatus Tectomicrobia bacterium]|nr:hypothetical protein [Candidatus Tectomicrobia bacterium]